VTCDDTNLPAGPGRRRHADRPPPGSTYRRRARR